MGPVGGCRPTWLCRRLAGFEPCPLPLPAPASLLVALAPPSSSLPPTRCSCLPSSLPPLPAWRQISDTVYPMYKAFIEPDLKAAHLRIYNTFNPFSGFMSPTYILKSARQVTKEDVCRVLKVGGGMWQWQHFQRE